MRELNWLPVKEHLHFRNTVMMYKCVHDLAPPYLCNKFSKRSDLHERHTRNRELFQIPIYNTTIGQRTFNYRGAKIWNSLDNDIKLVPPLKSFKNKLKKDMLVRLYT